MLQWNALSCRKTPCPKRYYLNIAEYNPMYCGFMVQQDSAAGPFGGNGTDAVVG